jgi:hypothetical protein
MSEKPPSVIRKYLRWWMLAGAGLLGIAVIGGYWAYSYYVFVPVCEWPSKSITMYLEGPKREGMPRRVTFRVPSAYMINRAYAPRLTGGKQSRISLNLNIRKNEPECLTKLSRFLNHEDFIYITISGLGTVDGFQEFMATQYQSTEKEVPAEDGFRGYRRKSVMEDFVVPRINPQNPIFFNCIARDAPNYVHGSSGCRAWTNYKGLSVQYGFRRSKLQQWQEIQKKAFDFIDSITIDIKQ